MDNFYISLLDKETRKVSNKIPLKDIIYHNDVEFEFEDEEIGTSILPYDDFLWFKDDYEVIIEEDRKGN